MCGTCEYAHTRRRDRPLSLPLTHYVIDWKRSGYDLDLITEPFHTIYVLKIEMAHGKDAKMLCKKIVNFFSLLSHTQETGVRRLGMTQELLSLVTGLAHYLKVLIRVALTCALTLVSPLFLLLLVPT